MPCVVMGLRPVSLCWRWAAAASEDDTPVGEAAREPGGNASVDALSRLYRDNIRMASLGRQLFKAFAPQVARRWREMLKAFERALSSVRARSVTQNRSRGLSERDCIAVSDVRKARAPPPPPPPPPPPSSSPSACLY